MAEIITSTKNDFVKLAKSLRTKKSRLSNKCFIVEGEKCVSELIQYAQDLIHDLIVLENKYSHIVSLVSKPNIKIHYVKDHVMNAICESKTPQGIAAIAAFPKYTLPECGFIVTLDNVQDPQNVGTIIRTADAAGCAGVVLSHECADYLSPKAIRASMGSIFHLPIIKINLLEYIPRLLENGYSIVSAHLNGDIEFTLDWQKTCLIIGNESRGISDNVQKLSTQLIKIPMYGKAESLNAAVAAGILIYKIRT